MQLARPDADRLEAPWRAALWIVLIAGASLGFSRAFACATPFVALATVAATRMPTRTAGIAVALAWAANQAVGFDLLGYPQAWDCFAWGGAIGLAAMGALAVAVRLARTALPSLPRVALAFLAGFATYEALLYAASFVLPTEGNAFSPTIVARVLLVNAIACAGLMVLDAVTATVEAGNSGRAAAR